MHDIAQIQAILAPLFPGLMGIALSEVSAERVVATLAVRTELCTTGQTLHGGAFMAFADTLGAIGTFIHLGEGQRTSTTDSSTKFIAAARLGSTVTGECIALHRGRSTMVWQTSIRDEAGKLCAVVLQTQLVLGAPRA
jgi:1,4-dihydroxy-2-naphthoyl-CoA hydrolase